MNHIEKLFNDDIRDKKRTGRGSFNKRGRGVRHTMRGIKTPYDFMKAKERKSLNGECVVTNMYTEIITKSEFDLKDVDTQKAMLTKWRELYPNDKIMYEMGINGAGTLAKYVNELGVPKKQRGGNKRVGAVETVTNKREVEAVKIISSGLNLEYHGEYTADQLNKIFTKLQLLIDGEESKFILNVSLSERS